MSRIDLIRERCAVLRGRRAGQAVPVSPPASAPSDEPPSLPAAPEAPPTSPSAPPPPTPAQLLALDALSAAPAGLALHELPRRVTVATMRVLLRPGQAAFVDDRWTLATAGVTIPPAGLNPSPGSLP